MDVEVNVRNLLIGARPRRQPHTDAVRLEDSRDGSGDTSHGTHERRSRAVVKTLDVRNVPTRNHQDVTGMELALVEEGDDGLSGRDETCRRAARRDVAECANGF